MLARVRKGFGVPVGRVLKVVNGARLRSPCGGEVHGRLKWWTKQSPPPYPPHLDPPTHTHLEQPLQPCERRIQQRVQRLARNRAGEHMLAVGVGGVVVGGQVGECLQAVIVHHVDRGPTWR